MRWILIIINSLCIYGGDLYAQEIKLNWSDSHISDEKNLWARVNFYNSTSDTIVLAGNVFVGYEEDASRQFYLKVSCMDNSKLNSNKADYMELNINQTFIVIPPGSGYDFCFNVYLLYSKALLKSSEIQLVYRFNYQVISSNKLKIL